jgi:hypothetical protein
MLSPFGGASLATHVKAVASLGIPFAARQALGVTAGLEK